MANSREIINVAVMGEPIQAAPTLTIDEAGMLNVYFGTGKYTEATDLNDSQQQSFYCVRDGVWFVSASPNGPWVLCDKVPSAIYTIPADHHNLRLQLEARTPGTVWIDDVHVERIDPN